MTGIEIGVVAGHVITAADALAATSAVMGAASMMQQGAQAQTAANYNAGAAEIQAINTKNAADYEEQLQREHGKKVLSAQRAAIGASGLGLEGSSLLAVEDSAQAIERDALAIRYSGNVDTARARSQAASDRLEGRAAQVAGIWGAGKSILSGASKISWKPAKVEAGVQD